MGRNHWPAFGVACRLGIAAASWGAALVVAQAVLGADIARAARELERRIELRIEGAPQAPPPVVPEHSHEGDESYEPWELVGV
jgi:hypothetical protein